MIAQYRIYLELAAALVLCIAIVLFVRHERTVGEQRQIQRDAIAVQKQAEAVAAQELEDRKAIQARSESYEAQLQALQHDLDNKPSSVVRVCHNANPSAVREAPAVAGGPGGTDSARLDRENGQDHSESVDIGPDLDQYKRDAQALALRCQAVIDSWPK